MAPPPFSQRILRRQRVFNEFAATPLGGRHHTPYGDALLGRLWAEHVGDAD